MYLVGAGHCARFVHMFILCCLAATLNTHRSCAALSIAPHRAPNTHKHIENSIGQTAARQWALCTIANLYAVHMRLLVRSLDIETLYAAHKHTHKAWIIIWNANFNWNHVFHRPILFIGWMSRVQHTHTHTPRARPVRDCNAKINLITDSHAAHDKFANDDTVQCVCVK